MIPTVSQNTETVIIGLAVLFLISLIGFIYYALKCFKLKSDAEIDVDMTFDLIVEVIRLGEIIETKNKSEWTKEARRDCRTDTINEINQLRFENRQLEKKLAKYLTPRGTDGKFIKKVKP